MRLLVRFVLAWLRFLVALALIVIGAVLVEQSFWFQKNVESPMRTPFVVAAVAVGIFSVVAGVRMIRAVRS